MKRSLILLLIVVVLAGYLGTLIARDPGYVLITYSEYSLQSSLWVMLGLIALISTVSYLLLRATGIVRKVPAAYRGWRGHQKSQRAGDLTRKGQRLLAEGEHVRARKFLESGAENSSSSAINHLEAAIAADHAGDGEARETFLRLAEEADSAMARARSVVAAELAINRGESDVALGALKNLKQNPHILGLKAKALRASGNWREMLASVSEMRKVDAMLADQIEQQAANLGFLDPSLDDVGRHQLFKSLSSARRQDIDCVRDYVRSLEDDSDAEPMLRSVIKKSWDPAFVVLYGELGLGSQPVRLKHAESWQKKHSTDAALQYCLGSIYAAGGEGSLARECLMRSIELGEVPGARQKLAILLADEGLFERSVEQFRLALAE